MKYFVLLFFLIPMLLQGQGKNVSIRILQEDSVFTPDRGQSTIRLLKKGFKIQVLLQNIDGVFTIASLSDSLYMIPDEEAVPHFASLRTMLFEDDAINNEKELAMCENCWCFWSYDEKAGARGFNKKMILLDSGRVVGTKSVKQLYFPRKRQSLKLKDIRQPLYLFFVAVDESDSEGRPTRELLRRKVKIEWKEED